MAYIDLHTHSVYSEGALSCRELLGAASKYGIKVLSLTDHNVIDGVPEITRLAEEHKIKIIPGVEIYTRHQNKGFHLLGYNFKPGKTVLADSLIVLQADHQQKVRQTVAELIKQGFIINAESLFSGPSRYLGVVHLIKELEKNPANLKKMEVELPPAENNYFGKVYHYFGYGQPAYLPQSELPTAEAIDIIKKSGGLAVLAHPGQQLTFEEDPIIGDLIKNQLDGLEVLSPYHNWRQVEHYQKMALDNNLIITGGSDYHTDVDISKKELIKKQWDYFKVPYEIYKNLNRNLN
ncbi:MAG: PHP domain-containing protein [Patescibacteria group bacterium]|jgi:hypothetical protein